MIATTGSSKGCNVRSQSESIECRSGETDVVRHENEVVKRVALQKTQLGLTDNEGCDEETDQTPGADERCTDKK